MLERTGSHGRGVEQRVPEMRRILSLYDYGTINVDNYSIVIIAGFHCSSR